MESKKEPLTESYFYILLCLYQHANHGYGIMQEAAELSGGRVRIGSGTMYGAVSNMMKKGWIAECDGEPEYGMAGASRNTGVRKKLYVLTDSGRKALEAELIRLIEMLESAEKIMGRPTGLLLKK